MLKWLWKVAVTFKGQCPQIGTTLTVAACCGECMACILKCECC